MEIKAKVIWISNQFEIEGYIHNVWTAEFVRLGWLCSPCLDGQAWAVGRFWWVDLVVQALYIINQIDLGIQSI